MRSQFKNIFILAYTFLHISFAQSAFAFYPTAKPNHDLFLEVEDQDYRKMPKGDWFTSAFDGEVYGKSEGTPDFYHGLGYWFQLRTEIRPTEYYRINTRSIFYSGSVSGGYSEPLGQYHLVGVYGLWPNKILDGTFEGRCLDLERQTIGQGLFIEEKETAGLWFKWTRDPIQMKFMIDGTGGLLYGDDMASYQIDLWDRFLGLGYIKWYSGYQSSLTYNRAPLYFVNSSHLIWDQLSYFIEYGAREDKQGGLVGFKYNKKNEIIELKAKIQARAYQSGFGKDFVGQIQQLYVSYDQMDKPYANTSNIFVFSDDAQVYSGNFGLEYRWTDRFFIHTDYEVGRFDFNKRAKQDFYFYRFGFSYLPFEDRPERITLFFSNKMLLDSYKRPTLSYSTTDITLFTPKDYFGFETNFSF